MPRQTESTNTKTFSERPVTIFRTIGSQSHFVFRELLIRYSGLKLKEEVTSGFMQRGTQIYYFGDTQIFWAPSMRATTFYTCNDIRAYIKPSEDGQGADNQYFFLYTIGLVTRTELNEVQMIHDDFWEFKFNILNASILDMLILQGDAKDLKDFSSKNSILFNAYLTAEPRIQITSIPDNKSMDKIFVFNPETKKYGYDLVRQRCLEPIVTNLSTLDLAILVKEHNLELHNFLIVEFVLSLNTHSNVINSFVSLLIEKQSNFDKFRAKSKAMEYLTNTLDSSINRNGKIKVKQWLDDVKLLNYIPTLDLSTYNQYLEDNFIEEYDLEMQRTPVNRQVYNI